MSISREQLLAETEPCTACGGSGSESDDARFGPCKPCHGSGRIERRTDKHGAVRPVSRVRLVYDGEPVSARVELVTTGEDGVETVFDIPVEQAMFYATPKSSRLVLQIDGRFVTSHVEGHVDHLAEHQLLAVARLDPNAPTYGWTDQPHVKAQEEQAPKTIADIETKPGVKRKR